MVTWEQTREVRDFDRTLPSGNYLSARLGLDGDADTPALPRAPASGTATALTARFEQSYRTLAQRLSSEPGVSGVTVARQLPGSMHDARRFQIDAAVDTANWEQRVQSASVDVNFYEVLRTPIVAGRNFTGVDSIGSRRAVIVNESFVREHLGRRGGPGNSHQPRLSARSSWTRTVHHLRCLVSCHCAVRTDGDSTSQRWDLRGHIIYGCATHERNWRQPSFRAAQCWCRMWAS